MRSIFKMTSVSLTFALFLSLGFSNISEAKKPQTISIDAKKSSLKWEGKKVTGAHDGFVGIQSAEVYMRGGKPVGGKVIVDLNTITNTDIKSKEYNAKLVGHLKSPDFFNVEKFPTAQFVVKKVKPVGASGLKQKYTFSGDLTIKGITKPLSFPAELTVKNQKYAFSGKFKIDRSEFDVRYNSKKFFDPKKLGDKLIYDEINFEVSLISK